MRQRTATTLQTMQRGNVSPAELVREALDLQAIELSALERTWALMQAVRARSMRSFREQIIMAATAEQRAQLGTFAERIDELHRKCR